MNQIAEPTPVKTPVENGDHYIEMATFREQYAQQPDCPYQATFSFEPFLEFMKECGNDNMRSPEMLALMDTLEQELLTFSEGSLVLGENEKLETLLSYIFPSLFFKGQMGFICRPFSKEFSFITESMLELMGSDEWEVKIPKILVYNQSEKLVREAANMLIKHFYGRDLNLHSSEILTLRHKKTKLEKYYKFNVVKDFIQVKALKPLRKLTEKQIFHLVNEWDNTELWLEYFPPENFAFSGLFIAYLTDVTDVEVLSRLKQKMVEDGNTEQENPYEMLEYITQLIRSYLELPDLLFGCRLSPNMNFEEVISWSIVGKPEERRHFPPNAFIKSKYKEVFDKEKSVIIGDLQTLKSPTVVEQHLIDKGIRSLLLAPLKGGRGGVIGAMELGATKPYQFSKLTLSKLTEVITFFTIGTTRWLQQVHTMVNLFIQQHFTSIHPSVEWRFTEVAKKNLWAQRFQNDFAGLDRIVFKNVYPLYGQADIVGSSKLRNHSIQVDLMDNLERVIKVIKACRKEIEFHLLDVFSTQAKEKLGCLQRGEYISSDESQIVELLTREIHPLLHELSEQFPQLPQNLIQKYFDYLDPKLNIVYAERKAYEDSVGELNRIMGDFIEQADEKMQEILPHFFEKYTTDGVEYNIYLGQSLLQKGTFSTFFLKDFRLWQLIQMCEITRLVQRTAAKLPMPLETAQLVFVYNNPMSIHFNMDEKQFDVDGAYNVRYEILKKRIDKAVIKETKERLTQSGKIAIVWLQDKDRVEYVEYLQHLIQDGYLINEIEELELEKLQGAEGLRALRVTVK